MIATRHVRPTVLAMALALAVPPALSAEVELLRRGDWPRVRSGETVVGLAPLRRAVANFDALSHPRLIIRYPGGDLGNAWAFEVRDWLVSLGIGSRHIVLEPGSGSLDALEIIVEEEIAQ